MGDGVDLLMVIVIVIVAYGLWHTLWHMGGGVDLLMGIVMVIVGCRGRC